MFIISNIKKYIVIAGLFAVTMFGAWKYYTYTQDQIRIFAQNAAVAKQAQAATQSALDQVQADMTKVREQFDVVNAQFAVAEERVDNLERKLAENDINYLASQKPGLVEKIVDNATANVLRCLEIASGSPLTEEEINATKRSQINGECPDIANPNYRP